MRISDWSSDVCSPISALDALLEEVFAFTNRVGFALFNIVFASSPSSFLARRFLGSFTQPFISVDSISFCGNIRSEKHTSELQSLMSSSYAVFCLKTKHKNILRQI